MMDLSSARSWGRLPHRTWSVDRALLPSPRCASRDVSSMRLPHRLVRRNTVEFGGGTESGSEVVLIAWVGILDGRLLGLMVGPAGLLGLRLPATLDGGGLLGLRCALRPLVAVVPTVVIELWRVTRLVVFRGIARPVVGSVARSEERRVGTEWSSSPWA